MNTTQLSTVNKRSGPRYLFSATLMAGALGFAAWGTTALFSDSLTNVATSRGRRSLGVRRVGIRLTTIE